MVHLWAARDALVLKALATHLAGLLPVSPRCVHVAGHGGAKAAVGAAWHALPAHRLVLKTDVTAYFESIDVERLLTLLEARLADRGLLDLLARARHRTITWGGWYWDGAGGLARSCPLSPLLGAFYLHALDTAFERTDLFYVRYMDDVLVLAPTHRRLRQAVRVLDRELAALGLEKHPDRRSSGRSRAGSTSWATT